MVFRSDPLGNVDGMRSEALRRDDPRTGGRELQPLVRGKRPAEIARKADHLSKRDIRPDDRMLEKIGSGQAQVFRDTPLPAEKEPGLRACDCLIRLEIPERKKGEKKGGN